jgi:hypothetical protein
VRDNLYYLAWHFEGIWIPDENGYPDYPDINYLRIRRDIAIRFRIKGASLFPSERKVVEVLINTQVGQWNGWNTGPDEPTKTIAFIYKAPCTLRCSEHEREDGAVESSSGQTTDST